MRALVEWFEEIVIVAVVGVADMTYEDERSPALRMWHEIVAL